MIEQVLGIECALAPEVGLKVYPLQQGLEMSQRDGPQDRSRVLRPIGFDSVARIITDELAEGSDISCWGDRRVVGSRRVAVSCSAPAASRSPSDPLNDLLTEVGVGIKVEEL